MKTLESEKTETATAHAHGTRRKRKQKQKKGARTNVHGVWAIENFKHDEFTVGDGIITSKVSGGGTTGSAVSGKGSFHFVDVAVGFDLV